MKKILAIAGKDLVILFRDRGALILMLGAPLVLTLGLGLVTGAFSAEDNAGIADIPLVLINQDEGEVGQLFSQVIHSAELADLFEPVETTSERAARQMVEEDAIAALIIIPSGFTTALLPDPQTGRIGGDQTIEIFASPARPISAGVVSAVVESVLRQVETVGLGVQVSVAQLMDSGRINGADRPQIASNSQALGRQIVDEERANPLIGINRATNTKEESGFNLLAFIAPGMAVFFLMYTVTQGGRSILSERQEGTLARMLISPTSANLVLGGKMVGIFLSGTAQLTVLIVASSLLFDLRWGDPLGTLLLVLITAAAATGWGLLLAALAKTPSQVSSVGTAMMLIFGLVGGSFFALPQSGLAAWLGKLTPNAWAMAGFEILSSGGSAADLTAVLIPLLIMAAVLFITAVILFRRRSENYV